MIQILVDGVITYDSRIDDYELKGLKVTNSLNKGGTAEIIMPPSHPSYNSYNSYKAIVEIFRDGILQFRGRAIYPIDDFFNQRTIVCEGEFCFFQDAISRPYLYQEDPAAVFAEVVEVYNSQVEAPKQFRIGSVTVTDPNNYIRLESESAESVLDTINKLLERCGGYIVFTTDPEDGARVVNWYASLDYRSNQTIELGENLLDFARSGANTNLVTAVLPYGAQDGETGERVTIESVNDGKDYIQDDEAVAAHGFIIKPVEWSDVSAPATLLKKARAWLAANRQVVSSLQLSALDMSYLDKSIDMYQVGDKIRVTSAPHNMDEDFLLIERTEDLLNPANSRITLGKEVRTLTGADVAGDSQSLAELQKATRKITADYQRNTANALQELEKVLSTVIEQASESILLEVSEKYTTDDKVTEAVSTSIEVLKNEILFNFNTLSATVAENDAEAREQIAEIYKYISFDNGDIKLGASDSAITLTLENDVIVFKKNGAQFGWWDGVDFHTGNIVVEVNERAQFGNFAFVPRSNGSLSFLKVGG